MRTSQNVLTSQKCPHTHTHTQFWVSERSAATINQRSTVIFFFGTLPNRPRQERPSSKERGGDRVYPLPFHALAQLLPQLRHDGQLLRLPGAAFQTGHRQDGHRIHEGGQLGELPKILSRGKCKPSPLTEV